MSSGRSLVSVEAGVSGGVLEEDFQDIVFAWLFFGDMTDVVTVVRLRGLVLDEERDLVL